MREQKYKETLRKMQQLSGQKDLVSGIGIKVSDRVVPVTTFRKHNEMALSDKEHPGVVYREPDLLFIICANAPMAYTTESGIKIIPVGCLGA